MKALLVASSGGHLTQLHHLRPRLRGIGDDVLWVTFDTPQSRALLAGEDVLYVDHTGSRDYRHVMTNGLHARKVLREREVSAVVSTGAAIALSYLPLARARGISCHYIESATRSAGPSTTGRLLGRVPGIELYTQHASWANDSWRFQGSVFDGFEARERRFPTSLLRRVVVTLGAHQGYGFPRLVRRLKALLPPETEVLWQTGATDVSDLGIEARRSVPGDELMAAIREADVVVSHAGIGSTLCAFEAGKCPVLVPRRASHGEHVDDHQCDIAASFADTDLAVVRAVETLTLEDLLVAAARRVVRAEAPPAFVFGGARVHPPVATPLEGLGALTEIA